MNGKSDTPKLDIFSLGDPNAHKDNLAAAMHREELNDIRIEKLGQRMTIITILLPCLIGIILFYVYLDIKKRVVDAQDTGQVEVKSISEDFELKVNAMNVELAKVQHTLEKQLPDLYQSVESIEIQLSELASTAAEKAAILKEINALKSSLSDLTNQHKEALHIIDRTNHQTLAILTETKKDLAAEISRIENSSSTGVTETATLLKTMNNRIDTLRDTVKSYGNTLSAYTKTLTGFEESIALNRKDISLINIRINDLYNSAMDKTIDEEINRLKNEYDQRLDDIEQKLKENKGRTVKNPSSGLLPKQGLENRLQSTNPSTVTGFEEDSRNTTDEKPKSISEKDLVQ